MIKIVCPLCQGKDFSPLFIKDRMNVVQCRKCGLIFTNPQPDQKELTAHYDRSYYYSPKKDVNDRSRYFDYNQRYLGGKEKKRFKNIFEKLSKIYPDKGKLLDVGAATGFFVKEAIKKGWKAEGVEISKWACDWGKKNLKVKLLNGDLKSQKLPSESYDCVTMLDFLEHVKNPLTELKEVCRILKKDGLVYIETINFDNLITRYLIGRNYVHMVPRLHLYYFGRKQIKKMLQKTGFQIVQTSFRSSSVGDYEYHSLGMYVKYLALLFNHPKGHRNFALNDVINVYAQKI